MAVGLVDGMVTPLQFKEERVLDKSLIPVMDKVKVVANEEFEKLFPKFQPSQVTISTTAGKSFTKRVDVPKGDPRDPMTAEEIGVKFHALGDSVIGKAACDRLSAAILGMEKIGNVRELTALTVRA
jgi:2-methylcitrate dehydratase